MAKTNLQNIFNKLKTTLLYSGYEVVLTKQLGQIDARAASWRFRKAKGYIAPDQMKIYINQAIGVNDRVITLIHELLHEISPNWTEDKVERVSKHVFKDLTVPQLGFLQFFVMTKTEMNAALKKHQAHSPIC